MVLIKGKEKEAIPKFYDDVTSKINKREGMPNRIMRSIGKKKKRMKRTYVVGFCYDQK